MSLAIAVPAEAEASLLLRSSIILGALPPEALAALAKKIEYRDYQQGDRIYSQGEAADDVYLVVSGSVQLSREGDSKAVRLQDGMFGVEAIGKNESRLGRAMARERCQIARIDGAQIRRALQTMNPAAAESFMRAVSDYSKTVLGVKGISSRVTRDLTGWALTKYRLTKWVRSPQPYLMVAGFTIVIGFWYLASEVWKLPRFRQMPGPTVVFNEWISPNPTFGVSIYTPDYYHDIVSSLRRVGIAFALATALGVPLGLLLGWSKAFRAYVFPIFEMLRPIPILAWVPLAILMFSGTETPVIFLTFLASFFATALNTMLGVESIDESYVRASSCLGASRWQTFRYVVIPGAMPYIFTGLQISIGVSWFSLVAGEMVSGQYGLGYLINTSYSMVRYPTIVIGMVTLGFVGYVTSALVRITGDQLMQWRVRELALGGR